MTQEELNEVLIKHQLWLEDEDEGERANLERANLERANLERVNLNGANLYMANFFLPILCPEMGAFIGWKTASGKIIKLEILADARRSSATGRKCRCDKAKVLEIQKPDGAMSDCIEVTSDYDNTFVYKLGEIVEVKNFDTDRFKECAAGIHFFVSREEAVRYSN